MSKSPLLLVDVDGCVGEFNTAFLNLLNNMAGRLNQRFPQGEPTVWDWPTDELTFSPGEVDRAWRHIDAERGYFWRHDVKPMFGTRDALLRLSTLDHTGEAEVYFVTARRTSCARRRTAEWLVNAGYTGHPAVITTWLKGKLAKTLKKRDQRVVVIDDKPANLEQCVDIADALYLVDHLYNRAAAFGQMVRVRSVMEALEIEFPVAAREAA
jgi:hypothetical protein